MEHQKAGEALRDRHLIERRLFEKASGALRERHSTDRAQTISESGSGPVGKVSIECGPSQKIRETLLASLGARLRVLQQKEAMTL